MGPRAQHYSHPLHHPLPSGRFIFGIGAGWLKEESQILGGDFPHRWTQTKDAILAMKELWTQDEAEYHGKYYDFPAVRCFPKPAQKPHPLIFLGGTDKNVFKRVVEWGDGWMPGETLEGVQRGRAMLNELAEQAGRDPRLIEVLAFGRRAYPERTPEPEYTEEKDRRKS